MKYIRTKDGKIIKVPISKEEYERDHKDHSFVSYEEWFGCFCSSLNILNLADTIEKLCDEFIMFTNCSKRKIRVCQTMRSISLSFQRDKRWNGNYVDKVYGAIWTTGKHGEAILKSIAKMNDKGELELI